MLKEHYTTIAKQYSPSLYGAALPQWSSFVVQLRFPVSLSPIFVSPGCQRIGSPFGAYYTLHPYPTHNISAFYQSALNATAPDVSALQDMSEKKKVGSVMRRNACCTAFCWISCWPLPCTVECCVLPCESEWTGHNIRGYSWKHPLIFMCLLECSMPWIQTLS